MAIPDLAAHRRSTWILAGGFIISLLAALATQQVVEYREAGRTRVAAGLIASEITRRVGTIAANLNALRAFFIVDRNVTVSEFDKFVRTLDKAQYIRAVQFIRVVDGDNLDSYQAIQTAVRGRRFVVRERTRNARLRPAGKRDRYFVIEHMSPLEGNEQALGLDVSSNRFSAEALQRAASTGRIASTGIFNLVQDPKAQAFTVYLAANSELGESQGFVSALVDSRSLLTSVMPFEVQIVSAEDVVSGRTIYRADEDPGRFVHAETVNVGDRTWRIRVGRRDSTPSVAASMVVFGMGGLLTLLALVTVARSKLQAENRWFTRQLTEHQQSLEAREAAYRSLFYNAASANMEADLDTGLILRVNDAMAEVTGKSPQELEGTPVKEIFHEDDRDRFVAFVKQCLAHADDADDGHATAELRVRSRDRKDIWHLVSIGEPSSGAGGNLSASVVMQDITAIKDGEKARDMLVRELAHRVRNTMQLVASLADQSAKNASSVADYRSKLTSRVRALNAAQDALFEANWGNIRLDRLVEKTLAPFTDENETSRISIDVAPVDATAQQAQIVALALHELANNAARHGALSVPGGKASLSIQVKDVDATGNDKAITMVWEETGCADVREPADKAGFGSVMLEKLLARQFGGTSRFTWRPQGILFEADLPLNAN